MRDRTPPRAAGATDGGDDDQQDDQRHGQRGRIPEVVELEGLLEDVHVHHAAGVGGPAGLPADAAGGDLDGVEDLEGADHGHDQHERQHRAQQRQRDRAEHPPLAGAVERGPLVVALRDHHQAAEQQQRGVAHVLPDVDPGDRRDDLALRLAFADLLQTGEHPQRGRLPAARRPYQDHELAVADLQVEVVDGLEAVVIDLRDAVECHACHVLPLSSEDVSLGHLRNDLVNRVAAVELCQGLFMK